MMNLSDLEKFEQAIALAERNELEAAHRLLADLRVSNPENSRIWLCYAFTTDNLNQARDAVQTVARLDPLNPSLSAAYEWLIRQERSQFSRLELRPTVLDQLNSDLVEIYREPASPLPVLIPAVPSTRPRFDWRLWLGIACLLAAFLIALTQFVLPKPMTEAERTYWQAITRLTERTNATNQAIQVLVNQLPTDYRDRLQAQFTLFKELNAEFRQLHSPSARFDRFDSYLTLAYNYFDDGATLLSNGLSTNNPSLIEQGNRALAMGNDFLRQARDALHQI